MLAIRRPGTLTAFAATLLLSGALAGCSASQSCPPGGCQGDALIKQHVDQMIYDNKAIQPFSITVQAKNGVVYLYGIVDTQLQKNVIEEETGKIQGVKRVVNSITVRGNVY
jgi:osmotically-inducible protein OsmY